MGCTIVVGVVECRGHHGGVVEAVLHCFVDFRWAVKISWRMGVFEQQDGAVVGVSLPLASGPLSMLNAHFRL